MRNEFAGTGLRRSMLPDEPMALFGQWFEDARQSEPWDGQSVVLATVDAKGVPSARVVLARGVDVNGFRFYTNYGSRKGLELAGNARCALVFWWPSRVRQVRVEGAAFKLDPAESDAYFSSRPRESRIGAWASAQSAVISGRQVLDNEVARVKADFEGREVSRPPTWGGYRVVPLRIEFWQGGQARLHDRFVYERDDVEKPWRVSRLAP